MRLTIQLRDTTYFIKFPAFSFSFEFRKTYSKAHSKPILEKVILLRHIAAFVK